MTMTRRSGDLQMKVDRVAGNVHDLAGVLEAVQDMAGLKPFFRFELELDHGPAPVTLLMCGDYTLEFLEHAPGAVSGGLHPSRQAQEHRPHRRAAHPVRSHESYTVDPVGPPNASGAFSVRGMPAVSSAGGHLVFRPPESLRVVNLLTSLADTFPGRNQAFAVPGLE